MRVGGCRDAGPKPGWPLRRCPGGGQLARYGGTEVAPMIAPVADQRADDEGMAGWPWGVRANQNGPAPSVILWHVVGTLTSKNGKV
jgi:hypothetical protein